MKKCLPQYAHSEAISLEMNLYLGGSDAQGAQRATQALLRMRKFDLAPMRKA